MANLVPAKCPSCGGTLVVDPDLEVCTCEYCNNAFMVQKAITNYTTNNITNVYKKKVTNEHDVELKEIDVKERKRSDRLLLGIAIGCFVVPLILEKIFG